MRLQDVANKAEVSVATVSRVVNELDSVRPATRKRVLAALKELDYTPNLQARSLVSGHTRTLGIIVSNLENPFFVDLFHLLERQAIANGYEVILANTNYDSGTLISALKTMVGRRVAGLAVAVSEALPSEMGDVLRAQIPIVCFNPGEGYPDVVKIRFDAKKGVRQLVEHLHALGHRRVAYIGHRFSIKTTEERRTAFVQSARRLKMEHVELAVVARDGWEAGRDAVCQLASNGFDASAILCVNDVTAFGVLRELRNRGLTVPGDVSVAGFDNIAISEFACPSLTTVHIPRDTIASMMFSMLTDEDQDSDIQNHKINSNLIVRESTGTFTGGGLISSSINLSTQRQYKSPLSRKAPLIHVNTF